MLDRGGLRSFYGMATQSNKRREDAKTRLENVRTVSYEAKSSLNGPALSAMRPDTVRTQECLLVDLWHLRALAKSLLAVCMERSTQYYFLNN